MSKGKNAQSGGKKGLGFVALSVSRSGACRFKEEREGEGILVPLAGVDQLCINQ
jgi:hypothetical protein